MAYLDHAATTPVLPEVLAAYVEAAGRTGNASSLHASGRAARRAVEESRERIAEHLGARPSEVVFTSGGTESDNLAVKGIAWARRAAEPSRDVLLIGATEHHAILDSAHFMAERQDTTVVPVEVDAAGRVTRESLAKALTPYAERAALVSVMWANNEVGTVQPVPELAALAAEHGVPLHTDAVQAIGAVPVDFGASGAAALTVTGHKIGGPVGVGALLLRTDVACTPVLHGGGQERDVRSGTLDVAGVVAFALAVELAVRRRAEQSARVSALRDELIAGVRAAVPDAVLNGDPADRLPGNAHFSFPGCEGDALLMLLDAAGVECSTGSACSAGVAQPSHVLLAMGADAERARSSLRFSLGHTSTSADVAALLAALPGAVDRARTATAVKRPR
ncbi:cysteine desulfurase family protein [Actinocatenispora rupis]|uniref:Cysteine desulfurase n=1 Tax=Actinocatenispora rupis TaxID=519421 RepID=A0A8J3JGH4_9ACTN|nr:cysteine desulfurase family protein [Actinocatenispora rupis]GID14448.1 cysteine desulfurase [Actinocatenispora rupis]